MKTNVSFWAVMALTLMAGCIPSLNPVYTEEQLVFDANLTGVWQQQKSQNKWEFSKRDERSYDLVFTDEQGRQGRFIARLADLDGTRFLDLYPQELETDLNGFYKYHLVPIHTIFRVRSTEPNVELAAIDFQWLDKYLAEHPDAIQIATFDGRKLITAPTSQVQQFVTEHKDRFTGTITLER
jgi:hypothetical protein